MFDKRLELEALSDFQKDLKHYIHFGLKLMQNLDDFFEKSNCSVKNKLMSSIFEEKIEFDGYNYRTPLFKDGLTS